jgi:recombination protein RecA
MSAAPDRVFEPGTGSHRGRGSRAETSLGDDPHRPRLDLASEMEAAFPESGDGSSAAGLRCDPHRPPARRASAMAQTLAPSRSSHGQPCGAPHSPAGLACGPSPDSGKAETWKLDAIAGRLAEVSAGAAGAPLTAAFRLVLEAQRRREPVAWIGRKESPFFPPDVAEAGIDLAALPVVWAPDATAAAGAADLLVRSGAFGLVVVDLGARESFPIPVQARLAGLARQHGAAVVCLTEKEDGRASMGSLVAVRAHAARAGREKDRYRCETRVLKDKGGRPGGRHAEVCRGPDGLH